MKINDLYLDIQNSMDRNELSNEDLVQIIELCGSFLNLKTPSNYAKLNNLSYNGVRKCRKNLILFGTKYIIDNE